MKANRVLEGQLCGWCSQPLNFGHDAALCTSCDGRHHATCWDQKGGCSLASCENAPLKRMEPAKAPAGATGSGGRPLQPGMMECPHCGRHIQQRSQICRYCKRAPTPDGVYRGPQQAAPGATASLVCGIIGLFICGIVLGIIAIVKANEAKRAIAADPRYTGGGMATAGLVLGIIDLVLHVLVALVVMGSR
jgi:hypothetical protein